MEKQIKIRKEDILTREWNKHQERKIMLELQIALQKELDPQEMSARKPLRLGSDGKPLSYQEITRREYIGILEGELEDVNLIISTIEKMCNE